MAIGSNTSASSAQTGGQRQQLRSKISTTTLSTVPVIGSKKLDMGELLGTGGFGSVYSVELLERPASSKKQGGGFFDLFFNLDSTASDSSEPTETYALKRINAKVLQFPKKRAMADKGLRNEARILSSLPSQHPHIIRLVGVSEQFWKVTAGDAAQQLQIAKQMARRYVVLEKLDVTLDKVLVQWRKAALHASPSVSSASTSTSALFRRNNKKDALVMQKNQEYQRIQDSGVVDIAKAVAFLHQNKIIFRDLKPSNIGFLEDEEGQSTAKLFDFGLARTLPPRGKEYRLTRQVGTPRYMAPEVVSFTDYGPAADVYSLATVVWELATLQKPFGEKSSHNDILETLMGVSRKPVDLLPNANALASPELKKLIRKCWDWKDTRRPTVERMVSELTAEVKMLVR